MKHYATIFFDLDDTLWDTIQNSKESLEEVYHKYQINRFYSTFDQFYNVYLPLNTSLWEKYSKGEITKEELVSTRFKLPFQQFDVELDSSQMNKDFLNLTASKSRVVDNAFEILDYLKGKYELHIISNGFQEVQQRKIDNAKLTNYFDKVILSDNIGINKPDRRIFDHALELTSTKREEAIMIGDNFDTDITGARNSNIDQVWFNPDGDAAKDFTPTHTISSLLELKSIL